MDDLISRQTAIDEFEGVKVDETYCTEYDIGYNDGIDFAVSRLSVLPSAQQWHVIKKRPMTEDEWKELSERLGYDGEYGDAYIYSNLPDDGQDVLVSTQYGVYEDTFHQDEECYFEANGDMDGVLAWMPLPKPYKGSER